MALFRRFFYRKPPDRLLEISERVYVFDCCFSTDLLDEDAYKEYMGGIVVQLQDYYPDASFMVFNFREGDRRSQISDTLSQYDMTVMEYPRQYENCPLLPLEMIYHFLRSSESWLSLEGQQNVLLMHCERGGWPVLAFMLAGLLLYRKQYNGEQKTLDMIYKQAPKELLQLLSPLNPQPSQMRYLQYISGRNTGSEWPPSNTPLVVDYLILRSLPLFHEGEGCRPVVRVYGQDPLIKSSRSTKLLFSSSKKQKRVQKFYKVDLRRANNTEIMLTKVKMPLPDMMAAALALDESVLDADQVENLIKFCPTKDEMELLKNYTGDKGKLGKCEQFFLELMKVPRVESKLRVFLFKIQFNSQVTDFKRSLNLVNSSCNEVRSSSKFKEVMRIILALGNTLNNGTARGGAYGFKLDSLLKLNETRATSSRMTLMHYLGKVLAKTYPNLLEFHADFMSLEAASKIQLKALAEEMQAITKGLEKVNQELAASENDGPVSETFCKTLKAFIGSAQTEVGTVMNLYSVVGRNADALVLYFGEDPARCPFEQVTQTLLNFVKSFRNAHEENLKQAEMERKKVQKEAQMEKTKQGNTSKEEGAKGS